MKLNLAKTSILGVTVLLISIVSVHKSASGGNSIKKGQVVYTNSLNGNLDYCHCPQNPNGGLVKRATAVKKLRDKNGDLLLCSTGDIFTYDPDPILADFLVKSMDHIDYDAICPGDQEMTVGMDELMKHSRMLPFVCANIQVRHGGNWRSPAKPLMIIRKNGIKYGITGIMHPSVFKYYGSSIKKNTRVTSPNTAVKEAVQRMRSQKVDCIVVLSHSGIKYDRELAKKHPDIDIIVGGHSQTLLKKPEKSGNTLIVQAGADGARIGILDITIENGSITRYKNRFIYPDEHQPADDPRIRKLIKQYREKVSDEYEGLRFD